MVSIRLDHILSYTNTPNIDDYLQAYVEAGFTRIQKTVKHNLGLRNGFIPFGPEYIEFLWVEDEDEFSKKADEKSKLSRENLRPISIGIATDDIHGLRKGWIEKGYKVSEISYGIPRGADPESEPQWGFLSTPDNELAGCGTFFLQYFAESRRENRVKEVPVAENGIFGLSGMKFVSDSFKDRAKDWKDYLAPDQTIEVGKDYAKIKIGSHELTWITPDLYQGLYDETWEPAKHDFGELAILQIISENLEKTMQVLSSSGRSYKKIKRFNQKMSLYVPKLETDGYRFQINEESVDTWMKRRTAITNETLEILRNKTSI